MTMLRQGERAWNSKFVLTKMCDALLYLRTLAFFPRKRTCTKGWL
jgi:hypothetical protein